jgi:hypothetical protein
MAFPKKQYIVDTNATTLRSSYLSGEFIEDVASLSPAELISNYGTHVMLGGSWGGRVDYNSSFSKKTTVSKQDVEKYAQIKAGGTFGALKVGANFSSEQKSDIESKFDSSSESKSLIIWGGDDKAGLQILNENDYNKWVDSLSNQNLWSWYDFCPGNYLIPITDFITDPTKKAAVTAELGKYYNSKKRAVSTGNIPAAGSQKGTLSLNGFQKEGGGYVASGGDGDVNSKSGRTTKWGLELSFTPSGRNIIMNYTYYAEEGAKNNTKIVIKGSANYSISDVPAGMSVKTINGGHNITGSGSIGGKNHSWISVGVSGLYDVQIKIDGSGDDQNNVAFKFNGSVPYTY